MHLNFLVRLWRLLKSFKMGLGSKTKKYTMVVNVKGRYRKSFMSRKSAEHYFFVKWNKTSSTTSRPFIKLNSITDHHRFFQIWKMGQILFNFQFKFQQSAQIHNFFFCKSSDKQLSPIFLGKDGKSYIISLRTSI